MALKLANLEPIASATVAALIEAPKRVQEPSVLLPGPEVRTRGRVAGRPHTPHGDVAEEGGAPGLLPPPRQALAPEYGVEAGRADFTELQADDPSLWPGT